MAEKTKSELAAEIKTLEAELADATAGADVLATELRKAKELIAELQSKGAAGSDTTTDATTDQWMKEKAFRLLWQSWRLFKGGATKREVGLALDGFRGWVGVARAEELEKSWRSGGS